MHLAGKTVLITGAGSGIGAACAREFAALGARVVVTDRAKSSAAAVAATLANSVSFALDVADVGGSAAVVEEISRSVGDIDVLVNNAGIFAMQPLLDVTPEHFDQLFAVNTRGMFFMLQATARTMVRSGIHGAIVNVASQAGRRGEAPSSVYAATKAAVISLTQSAALALTQYGIRVNAVAPGVVDTPMWQDIDSQQASAQLRQPGWYTSQVVQAIPARRLGQPFEIAKAVAFLASSDSSYLLGQTINIDGGNVMS